MERLSALDAAFLEVEDSDPHVSLAIGGVSIMEGPAPGFDEFVAAFSERVQNIPRCTQMLHRHSLDIGSPEWVEDPHFDISRHLHHRAVPAPGGDAELFELVAAIMERRLDRERPLWDCFVIEGLSDGRWAVLTKLHHCIADGIATTQMLAQFSDDGGGESFATHIHAATEPEQRWRLTMNLNPLSWARSAVSAGRAVEHAAWGAAGLTASLFSPAPSTSLSGPVTKMRRYAVARVKLADLHEVADAFDVTLNDVALAAITSSYRRLLLERGEKPSRNSLRTLVPVSVRGMNHFNMTDNQVSAMLPLLPVDEDDPVTQLELVHDRLTAAKGSGQREGGNAVISLAKNVPFVLSAWMVRLLSRLPQRAVVALATNVPGPRTEQKLLGRRVLEMLPIPPIALNLRTGVAMVSYADSFIFGITGDYENAPDVTALASGIEQGVARLVEITHALRVKRRTKPRAAV
ncbi:MULTISPECIES: WS/DGAT/MGAT family O-acyltransferase [Mycobacterium]|uniref:Diacylglycerol O-acyltransferase n=1 Tax=Mycobacterium kiyosense TaxID=2871094 RepID=A0A9P3UXD4_9MYCO|nr:MULTISPECIES: wax ester/triacylglycerol synthase family O-acyltransferase [Mycobacterium]BDE14807.1 putative diacyglycerol O-acyltransferase [Mycobacterium sp. 20KCMC460]GLB96733.1 putative diacyglycerol O-acyltransferase [Mycobacterium kiyosense]GLC01453.1 putative diacyglycerol O-acyltransferase [Mycobacterium kiyosense]GLD17344.1 putative diacyglycerol O-acyltransferase [Mycobacterium kiyosense]GLD30106.1 putative diacyglycerol O-acyltransferase [Mycobacterium kiyosense]